MFNDRSNSTSTYYAYPKKKNAFWKIDNFIQILNLNCLLNKIYTQILISLKFALLSISDFGAYN